ALVENAAQSRHDAREVATRAATARWFQSFLRATPECPSRSPRSGDRVPRRWPATRPWSCSTLPLKKPGNNRARLPLRVRAGLVFRHAEPAQVAHLRLGRRIAAPGRRRARRGGCLPRIKGRYFTRPILGPGNDSPASLPFFLQQLQLRFGSFQGEGDRNG